MPFDRAFDDVYRLGIKGAVEQFDDVLAELVDEQIQQSICLFPESPVQATGELVAATRAEAIPEAQRRADELTKWQSDLFLIIHSGYRVRADRAWRTAVSSGARSLATVRQIVARST
jgi:hypothetical protein